MSCWRCTACKAVWLDSELLSAINPFADLCDEPNCNTDASCGWPDGVVYRRTCDNHRKDVKVSGI